MNPILRKTIFASNDSPSTKCDVTYRVLHGGWWFQETFYHDKTGDETSYNYRIEEKKVVVENDTTILFETLVPIHEDWIVMPCFQDPIVYHLVSPPELAQIPPQWKTPSFVVTQSV